MNDSPLAYYRLNDTTSTMTDSGSHQLNGSYGTGVQHSAAPLTTAGDASAVFPASPAGSSIPANTGSVPANSEFATITTGLTVEAWIKPTGPNTTGNFVPIVSYGRGVIGSAWSLRVNPQSDLDFFIKVNGGAGGYELKSPTAVIGSGISHVVATYNGSVAKLYLNGALVASTSITGPLNYTGITSQDGLDVGGELGNTRPVFNGAINDVAIYPSALSAADVLTHFQTGLILAAQPSPTPAPSGAYTALIAASNPLAYYKLGDSGTTMADGGSQNLVGTYGANVTHGAPALTSALDHSTVFPGSPAGSNVALNTGTVPANAAFTAASSALSVEAWIKPADFNRTNNFVPIVSYGRGVIGSAWSIRENPQSQLDLYLKVNGGAGGYELAVGSVVLSPAQLYHVVATYDGSNAKLYVNGNLVGSMPATGTLNYSGVWAPNGLAVGGELGNTRPIYNGAINDLSIYSRALTAAQVQQHFLVGQLVAPVVETPTSSDAFVDSIGVVTHLGSTTTAYSNSWPTFVSLIESSGIRHIGDSLVSTPSWYVQHIQQLAAAGIHASLITNLNQTSQEISSSLALFSNAVEAVEGPNEVDLSGDPNWIADSQAFQRMLYSTVKGNTATSKLAVVGPSVVHQSNDVSLGNLSAYMDEGSMHDYFDGFNPGTAGWGSLSQYGIYGSIPWNKNIAAIVAGSKPIVATETGYGSILPGGIDSRTLARYIPRLYLEHFLNGVPRTTLYEFYDDPVESSFSNFGLVDVNNNPKASYFAVKSLIGTLADPGSSFATTPLSYELAGNTNNVKHLLLQKRDGTYELVLWVEAESWNPATNADITVPAQAITVSLSQFPSSASVSVIGDSGSVTTQPLSFNAGVASLSIDDHVSIVTFK